MKAVADGVDQLFNGKAIDGPKRRKFGFVLVVFPFRKGRGQVRFVSNTTKRRATRELQKLADDLAGSSTWPAAKPVRARPRQRPS
ncbi:hypothetical protein BRAS3843_1090028 [Bradyrhizobium sp. STM 3843]|uniref:hypothetical protein n=1 Tax=Bradyrhizobium sp. STM 3843 TaxID=551947 RepID=UPI000240A8AB|nr:hypothetical protein [Bradyrhizobium sp. STM 3843]CCE04586.1 hypothetical protein BRAS3843_1090028 [Bradyrhizobium sp. STM 3843]